MSLTPEEVRTIIDELDGIAGKLNNIASKLETECEVDNNET